MICRKLRHPDSCLLLLASFLRFSFCNNSFFYSLSGTAFFTVESSLLSWIFEGTGVEYFWDWNRVHGLHFGWNRMYWAIGCLHASKPFFCHHHFSVQLHFIGFQYIPISCLSTYHAGTVAFFHTVELDGTSHVVSLHDNVLWTSRMQLYFAIVL
jgi:hypothetical protein